MIAEPKILNDYPKEMVIKPFFKETWTILNCVHTHNFELLSSICDDDFGIIDINTEGGSEIIRNREGWENWFKSLFEKLDEMEAKTWSEITNYEALMSDEMGYGVVDFDQFFIHNGKALKFSVIATIIWKFFNGEWKESRYHSSLIKIHEI